MRSLLVLLLALCTLTACGDDDATPIDAGPPDAAASDAGSDASAPPGDLASAFCAPLGALICERGAACGCGVPLPGGALDRAACEARFAADCVRAWGALAQGGALVDTTRAAACVALVEARTPGCQAPHDALVLAHCEPFVVHPAALGEPCASPFCAGGAGTCAEGTCIARRGADGECADPFSCATGLQCHEGRCIAPRTANESCQDDVMCAAPLRCIEGTCSLLAAASATCEDTAQCGEALVCDEGTCAARDHATCSPEDACGNLSHCSVPRACRPRLGLDAPCQSWRQCEASLYCDDASRTCAARPGAGAPCGNGIACADGLGCDVDGGGTCVALPGAGSACVYGELGPLLCADGLGCTDGVCGPLPVAGEACTSDSRCAPGLGCDFTAEGSFCIAPRGEGGACQSDRSCAEEFHCADVCTADLGPGAPCSAGNECAGICGLSTSGGLACRDAPGEGDPCLFDDDCGEAAICVPIAESARCVGDICRVVVR